MIDTGGRFPKQNQASAITRPIRVRLLEKCPKDQKARRAQPDVIGAGTEVMRIATGEEQDEREAPTSAAAQRQFDFLGIGFSESRLRLTSRMLSAKRH